MQWYYSKNGTQLGPVAQGELISKLASGEVSPSDLVWKDGMGDWIPASQVGELRSVGSAPPVPPAAAEQVSAAPDSPYVSPVSNPVPQAYSPVPVPVPGSGKATASMVLGIVAVVTGLCGCYGMIITLICGILAIVFGNQVKKEALLNPALAPDLGKAKAGAIMGWVGIGLGALITLLLLGLGLAGGMMEQMNK